MSKYCLMKIESSSIRYFMEVNWRSNPDFEPFPYIIKKLKNKKKISLEEFKKICNVILPVGYSIMGIEIDDNREIHYVLDKISTITNAQEWANNNEQFLEYFELYDIKFISMNYYFDYFYDNINNEYKQNIKLED